MRHDYRKAGVCRRGSVRRSSFTVLLRRTTDSRRVQRTAVARARVPRHRRGVAFDLGDIYCLDQCGRRGQRAQRQCRQSGRDVPCADASCVSIPRFCKLPVHRRGVRFVQPGVLAAGHAKLLVPGRRRRLLPLLLLCSAFALSCVGFVHHEHMQSRSMGLSIHRRAAEAQIPLHQRRARCKIQQSETT